MNNKQLNKYWDRFLDIAESYGYSCINHNDHAMGTGSILFKSDKFVPIIQLCIWQELKTKGKVVEDGSISIHVEDRNGNSVLDGPTCAIHCLKDCPDLEEKFEKMCSYVFEKYSKYSKQNRLDFVFNELPEERIEWDQDQTA